MKITIAELMQRSGVGFGTSGARGLVAAMSDEVCYLYTAAFLQYLQRSGQIEFGCEVAVAGDLRASTPRILSAVIRAVEVQGFRPLYCGFIPSPAVVLVGIERQIPSIMVTGSHIPDDRNGIKFNRSTGEILKFDEEAIRQQQLSIPKGLFDDHGRFVELQPLLKVNPLGREIYLNRYLALFPIDLLDSCRVGVYEHSSVARDLMVDLLKGLGAETIRLGRSEQFIPVDTEAIRQEDVELSRRWIVEHQLDSIVSTDGDGDRPLISDENGEWLRGDVTGILTARYLQAQSVVTPVNSNSALEKCDWFEQVIRTRIGSPYVIEGMQQAVTNASDGVVGYEANGGFLQETPIDIHHKTLAPLPTRDAMIVIIAILAMSREQNTPISKLRGQLPERYTYSDRLKEFPLELSREKLEPLSSGHFERDAEAFVKLFGESFGEISAIDYTDGVRFTFDNSKVVHLRPSGNAPELRCYTESDTKTDAGELGRNIMAILDRWRS